MNETIPKSFEQSGLSKMPPGTPVTVRLGEALFPARFVSVLRSGDAVFELTLEGEVTRIALTPTQCIDVGYNGQSPRGLLASEITEGLRLLNSLLLTVKTQVALQQLDLTRLAWVEKGRPRVLTADELWLIERALHESIWRFEGEVDALAK